MVALRESFHELLGGTDSGLRLPALLAAGQRGRLVGGGWTVAYGVGETDTGALYLDVYTSHRMADDCLHRIHYGGRVELVDAVTDFWPCCDDPREQERIMVDAIAAQRRFDEALAERGLYELVYGPSRQAACAGC